MTDIEVGSVVQLKSGGPEMTVDSISEKGEAYCLWFSHPHAGLQDASFTKQALTTNITKRYEVGQLTSADTGSSA